MVQSRSSSLLRSLLLLDSGATGARVLSPKLIDTRKRACRKSNSAPPAADASVLYGLDASA